MAEPLTFLSRVLGVSARIGAIMAFAALLIFLGRRFNIEPLTKLDETTYTTIIAAGFIGFSVLVIDFVIISSKWLCYFLILRLRKAKAKKQKRITALKNLGAIRADLMHAMRYIIANGAKRFPAPSYYLNPILGELVHINLIEAEISDPNQLALDMYYSVPEYVWVRVKELEPMFAIAPPERAPWKLT